MDHDTILFVIERAKALQRENQRVRELSQAQLDRAKWLCREIAALSGQADPVRPAQQ